MLLSNAFNYLIRQQGREVTIEDLDTATSSTTWAAKENKFKTKEEIEEIGINTTVYKVSAEGMDTQPVTVPKRGFRLIDPQVGEFVIESVEPLFALGTLVGWRIFTI